MVSNYSSTVLRNYYAHINTVMVLVLVVVVSPEKSRNANQSINQSNRSLLCTIPLVVLYF
jgi:hypothetical protein